MQCTVYRLYRYRIRRHLEEEFDPVEAELKQNIIHNALAKRKGLRPYNQWRKFSGVCLWPLQSNHIEQTGKFLIHSEGCGPHCVAVIVSATRQCELFDGINKRDMPLDAVNAALRSATDKDSLMIMTVDKPFGDRHVSAVLRVQLLQRLAGMAPSLDGARLSIG